MEWLRASLFCPELFDDWLSCCLNVLYIMNSVHASRYYHVYILNDDQNFTNRRANVRKCKYQYKDKFRLLHSKYVWSFENGVKER